VAAVLVAVAQVERQTLCGFDRVPQGVGVAAIGIAFTDRALPIPHVTGRDVQAAYLRDEGADIW